MVDVGRTYRRDPPACHPACSCHPHLIPDGGRATPSPPQTPVKTGVHAAVASHENAAHFSCMGSSLHWNHRVERIALSTPRHPRCAASGDPSLTISTPPMVAPITTADPSENWGPRHRRQPRERCPFQLHGFQSSLEPPGGGYLTKLIPPPRQYPHNAAHEITGPRHIRTQTRLLAQLPPTACLAGLADLDAGPSGSAQLRKHGFTLAQTTAGPARTRPALHAGDWLPDTSHHPRHRISSERWSPERSGYIHWIPAFAGKTEPQVQLQPESIRLSPVIPAKRSADAGTHPSSITNR